MNKKSTHDPFKKYTLFLDKSDQEFLNSYMSQINAIWREYLSDRKNKVSGGMTMTKRDQLLKAYRERLHEINIKHKKG